MSTLKYTVYLHAQNRKEARDPVKGMEAQRAVISAYLDSIQDHSVSVLVELAEISHQQPSKRSIYREAIDHCVSTGSTLLIATVDPLRHREIDPHAPPAVPLTVAAIPNLDSGLIRTYLYTSELERQNVEKALLKCT